jgi:hypothetical protein
MFVNINYDFIVLHKSRRSVQLFLDKATDRCRRKRSICRCFGSNGRGRCCQSAYRSFTRGPLLRWLIVDWMRAGGGHLPTLLLRSFAYWRKGRSAGRQVESMQPRDRSDGEVMSGQLSCLQDMNNLPRPLHRRPGTNYLYSAPKLGLVTYTPRRFTHIQ